MKQPKPMTKLTVTIRFDDETINRYSSGTNSYGLTATDLAQMFYGMMHAAGYRHDSVQGAFENVTESNSESSSLVTNGS